MRNALQDSYENLEKIIQDLFLTGSYKEFNQEIIKILGLRSCKIKSYKILKILPIIPWQELLRFFLQDYYRNLVKDQPRSYLSKLLQETIQDSNQILARFQSCQFLQEIWQEKALGLSYLKKLIKTLLNNMNFQQNFEIQSKI